MSQMNMRSPYLRNRDTGEIFCYDAALAQRSFMELWWDPPEVKAHVPVEAGRPQFSPKPEGYGTSAVPAIKAQQSVESWPDPDSTPSMSSPVNGTPEADEARAAAKVAKKKVVTRELTSADTIDPDTF